MLKLLRRSVIKENEPQKLLKPGKTTPSCILVGGLEDALEMGDGEEAAAHL